MLLVSSFFYFSNACKLFCVVQFVVGQKVWLKKKVTNNRIIVLYCIVFIERDESTNRLCPRKVDIYKEISLEPE